MNQFSNFQLAQMAAFVACSVLVSLGYFIGLKKSVLTPCTSVWFLGCLRDSEKQAFIISDNKRISFASLRESILEKNSVSLKNLQKFAGRPPHFPCWFLRESYTTIACFKPLPRPLEKASCKFISPHLCVKKFHIGNF